MALTNQEKNLIEEALAVYLQIASQQLPQQHIQQLAATAQSIIGKLGNLGTGGEAEDGGNKPTGISDEWFESVCKGCDKLGMDGCADTVTMKFPGKCDPILHYERAKSLNQNL